MTLCAVAADIGVFLIEAHWTKPKIKSNKKVTITLSTWCIEMSTELGGGALTTDPGCLLVKTSSSLSCLLHTQKQFGRCLVLSVKLICISDIDICICELYLQFRNQ